MSRTIHARFAAVVARHPEAPAVVVPGGSPVSYAALAVLRDETAQRMAAAGLGPRDVLALALPTGPAAVAAVLACQLLGVVPCQLDPATPAPRLRHMLTAAQPRFLLSDPDDTAAAALVEAAAALGVPPLPSGRAAGAPVPASLLENDPAYIMFTSGSTGAPKGVLIAQGAVVRLADWARATFQLGPGERVTHVNPLYFDNAVFDLYATLLNGACLVALPQALARLGRPLVAAVAEAGCTVWFSVPSLLIYLTRMRAIDPGALPALRQVAFGGEGYPLSELARLAALLRPDCTLWNVYGPTEGTCICSARAVQPDELARAEGFAPLGWLAPDFRGVLLDEDGAELAGPATGELALLGPQLALGYVRDPERTARSFPLRPANGAWSERMYRTGDLVRRDEDGCLHFVGRADNQIKHMGYRIELEEIDAALNALAPVAAGVAVYLRTDAHFGRIEAVVSLHDAAGLPDGRSPEALRTALAQRLPPYMLPARLHVVPALPRNANGKVDRRAARAALDGS